MMIKLFDLGICFFEGYMYYIFWNNFLKLRSKKKLISITILIVAIGIIFIVNRKHIASLNLVASIVVSIITGQILFSDSPKKKLFYSLLSVFIIVGCEFVMVALFCLPLGEDALHFGNDPTKMFLLTISAKLLTFLVMRVICHVSDNGKGIFFPHLMPYFSCFPISCMILYIGIAYSSITFYQVSITSIVILCGCIFLLFANIILFIVYDRMVYAVNRVKEYELTDVKRKLENQHYLQIEEINKKHSGILHDMNNYLKTIETLAEEADNKKIIELLGSFNSHIIKIREDHYCKNQILNAILSGKKQEAIQKEIIYKVYVEPGFEKPGIEDIDLISIMTNLIDNAIEAAEKCDKGFIDIQLYKANDGRFTVIKITNNYKSIPQERDGDFISQKENPGMHGIGLRNVKSIIEQSGGWYAIEYGESQFCITIIFV